MLIMNRLFILILFAANCHSQDYCQNKERPPHPESGCCGIQLGNDDFQTSGDAADNQFPWLALIESESGDMSFTGVLISSRHVLTTAQVDLFLFDQVRLGVFKRNQTDNDAAVTIDIISMQSNAYIAVMLLAQNAPYNEFIRPICLPTSEFLDSTPYKYRFTNAGWSKRRISNYESVDVKHYVTLPHVRRRTCQDAYDYKSPMVISDNQICAGGGSDISYLSITCQENGGSPLMIKEKGRYSLLGITTFGSNHCGIQAVPDVFLKIYPYLSFIKTVAADLLKESLNPFGFK